MRVEPASREFSRSSLTTEAGRSTTSPAAILLATDSERTWILPMGRDPSLRSGFRLRALPFALLRVTPAKRLNLPSGDFIGNGFGEDVDFTHGVAAVSFSDERGKRKRDEAREAHEAQTPPPREFMF